MSVPVPVAWESPLRVVHLVTTLNIGGLEKVVLDLVRYRTGIGGTTHVICLAEDGALAPDFAEMGVPVEIIGRPGDTLVGRIVRLARRLRQLDPDVLHTHNPGPHLHGAAAARLAGVPVVVHTKHGRNFPGHRKRVLINRYAAAITDCVVAVSEDAAAVARDVERVPNGKVRIVHNGVDLGRYPFRPARPDDGTYRAVTVARLDPVKNQASMLRAVRRLVDRQPNFTLDVVGDGPSRPELEALCASLGLGEAVRFHGFQSRVAPFLAEADFFVLSSISEGIALTLLEAMAVGLPAVATNVGGNREVIVHGETGYLVPSDSDDALADAMLAIQSRTVLGPMGIAARRRVETEFSLARVVERYEAIYGECLARRGARPKGSRTR